MIVKFPDGKISGDAFACFENEEDLTKALQLNKSMLGTRYVELFKSSQKELEVVRDCYELVATLRRTLLDY